MSQPVSIVLPTLNERSFIRDCLDSLAAQDYPNLDEILVVDGGSTDGTRDLVEAFGGIARVVDNPGVTAASAMNVGIAAARNELIVRADAHTLYAVDYVSQCVATLESTDAAVVGGPMRPAGVGPFGRAVAAVTSSPFGVGPGKFHYSEKLEEVDTVYLGAYYKSTVLEAGGYDAEHLQWAAEDQELNFRIRQRSGRIVLNPAIRSEYFPRDTPRSLFRQYHNYGLCKASTFKKHRTLPYWRPLVPAAMVGATAVWVLTMVGLRRLAAALAPVVLYGAGAVAVSVHLSRERGVTPHRVLAVLSICHWGYGAGVWRGLGRILTGRPFDVRPGPKGRPPRPT